MMRAFLAVLMILIAVPAMAKTWDVDYGRSHLGFSGKQSGESFEGGFKNFTVTIDLDPTHPEGGKITASIDIASATAGSADRDTYLPHSDWFNTAKFPKAEFVSTSIHSGSTPSCFEAAGNLTIKGISQPLTLPFCLKPEGDHMRATGSVTLLRNNFSIGTGQWADEGVVANAVMVNLDIAAK